MNISAILDETTNIMRWINWKSEIKLIIKVAIKRNSKSEKQLAQNIKDKNKSWQKAKMPTDLNRFRLMVS